MTICGERSEVSTGRKMDFLFASLHHSPSFIKSRSRPRHQQNDNHEHHKSCRRTLPLSQARLQISTSQSQNISDFDDIPHETYISSSTTTTTSQTHQLGSSLSHFVNPPNPPTSNTPQLHPHPLPHSTPTKARKQPLPLLSLIHI